MLSMKKKSFGTAGFFVSGSNGASLSLKISLLSKSRTLSVVFFSRAWPNAWIDLGPNLFPSSSSFLSILFAINIFARSTPSSSSIFLRAKCRTVSVLLNATFEANILHLAGPRFRPERVYSLGVLLDYKFFSIISIRPSSLFICSSSSRRFWASSAA